MLIILFVIIGIVMVSIITYLIIKFCFESKLKTRYIRTPRRALRNQTSDIGCPVTIIVHSSSSNGNIEIDYMDMPPSYSRSNSIHYSPQVTNKQKSPRIY